MRGRAIIPLVVGLGVGIFAIKMFVNVLQNARGSNTSDMVEVVSAAADINATLEISEAMVSTKKVPKALAPKMAFATKQEVVGRVAGLMIPNGSAITANMLAPKGTPPGLAVRIPAGYRAVAIKTDEYAGVGGWLKPRARVDVVAMMVTQANGRRQTICRTILQDIEVLAVGPNLEKVDSAASVTKSVTLAVRPGDVTTLHLAASQNGSKLRLAMRGQSDRSLSVSATTTDNDLLAGNIGQNSSAEMGEGADSRPTFLRKMFGNPSKNGEDATDKVPSGSVPTGVAIASAAPVRNEWVVEVINGSDVEYIRFDGNDSGARRLNEKSRNARSVARPVGLRALPVAPRLPVKPAAKSAAPAADSNAVPTPVQLLE